MLGLGLALRCEVKGLRFRSLCHGLGDKVGGFIREFGA